MTENIKTTISTGKNTFDAKGDFLPCGNYYYKINGFKNNIFYGDLSCRGEYGTFCFKPLDLVQMLAIGQSRLARRTELNEDKLPNYDSPVTSPANIRRRTFLNTSINMKNTSRLNVVNTYTEERKTNVCSICLVETLINIKKLPCGHEFHKHCIDSWLGRKNTCPNCRKEVRRAPPEVPPPEPPLTPNRDLFTMSNRTPIFNNYVYTRLATPRDINSDNTSNTSSGNTSSLSRRISRYEEQYLVHNLNPRHPDD